MPDFTHVIEYQCPCCGAGLRFDGFQQQLKCDYCDNSFDIDTVRAFNEAQSRTDYENVEFDHSDEQVWSDQEQNMLNAFICPACGGEIITDSNTVATFCPYCDNPTIMPGRLSGGLKPDALIPFRTSRDDAKNAFLKLCKGKPLLPRLFTQEQQLQKITGIYVPFWLYDCDSRFDGNYKATRVHVWSDSNYNYTKTDHFFLKRSAEASFIGIPMDGSSKMDDAFMESIEPYDYQDLTQFHTAYLTGFLADKYDVSSDAGEERVKQRVNNAINEKLQSSFIGYSSIVPTSRQLNISHSKARYVLMPVWMLNTRYKGKIYTFAMNGQTGKMTGTLPICPKRSAAWFAGITAGVAALAAVVQLIAF